MHALVGSQKGRRRERVGCNPSRQLHKSHLLLQLHMRCITLSQYSLVGCLCLLRLSGRSALVGLQNCETCWPHTSSRLRHKQPDMVTAVFQVMKKDGAASHQYSDISKVAKGKGSE